MRQFEVVWKGNFAERVRGSSNENRTTRLLCTTTFRLKAVAEAYGKLCFTYAVVEQNGFLSRSNTEFRL